MEDKFLKMIGHGTDGSDGIEPGIHLRWAFNYKLGFPPCFKLYRRASNLNHLHVFDFNLLGKDNASIPYSQESSSEDDFTFKLASVDVEGKEVSTVTIGTVILPNKNPVQAIQLNGELTFSFSKTVSRLELGFEISSKSEFQFIVLSKDGEYYPQTVLGTSKGFQTIAFDAPGTVGLILRGEGIVFGKLRAWACGKAGPWTRIHKDCGCGLPVNHEGTNYTAELYPKNMGNDLAITLCRLGVRKLKDTEFTKAGFLKLKAILVAMLAEGVLVPWGWTRFPTTPNNTVPEDSDNEFEYSKYDFLLTQSLHVLYAKILDLYYVDTDIDPNTYYDYKVTAKWPESNLRQLEHQLTFEDYEVGHIFFYSPILDDNVVLFSTSKPVVVEQDFPMARTEKGILINTVSDFISINFLRPVTEIQLGIVNLDFAAGQSEIVVEAYKKNNASYVDRVILSTDQGLVRVRAPEIDSLKIFGTNYVISRIHYEFDLYPVGLQKYIICGVKQQANYPLETPTGLKVSRFPGGTVNDSYGNVSEKPYMAGLRWDANENPNSKIISIAPILYHVKRKKPGRGEITLTKKSPVFISPSTIPSQKVNTPAGWPRARQFYFDTIKEILDFRYRIAAKDLFGRISKYTDLVGYSVSQTRPPHPIDVTAQFLDYSTYDHATQSFSDSTLNKDDREWLKINRVNAIVVRWKWTVNLQLHAPDVDSFNVFYKQGWLNNYSGEVTSEPQKETLELTLTPAEADKYTIFGTNPVTVPVFRFQTALKLGETVSTDAFRLCWLNQGNNRFLVLKNTGGSTPILWILDQRPEVNYVLENRKGFSVSVTSENPHFIDYNNPHNWTDTSVSHNQPKDPSGAEGYTIYIRNLAFPNPQIQAADIDKIRYAQIAVNSQINTIEGSVSSPATIMAIYRSTPPAPNVFAPIGSNPEAMKATPANVHGKSSFALRWEKNHSSLKHHVYRAMDDTLFIVDNQNRPRGKSFYTDFRTDHPEFDPTDVDIVAGISHQSDAKQVRANYINLTPAQLQILASLPDNENAFTQLTGIAIDETDETYDDRVTEIPHPVNGSSYTPDPGNVLLYYDDNLDGRGGNRYFYALKTLDTNGLFSPLSTSTLPVECPNVTPPPRPTLTSVLGDDKQVRVKWAKNPGAYIAGYLLYRSDHKKKATDWRRMKLLKANDAGPFTVEINGGLPVGEFEYIDQSVTPRQEYYYAVVAVSLSDEGKWLKSQSSEPKAGQAFDLTPPSPPELLNSSRTGSGNNEQIDLQFAAQEQLQYILQRKTKNGTAFLPMTGWLDDTRFDSATHKWLITIVDKNIETGEKYDYRLKVMNVVGNTNFSDEVEAL